MSGRERLGGLNLISFLKIQNDSQVNTHVKFHTIILTTVTIPLRWSPESRVSLPKADVAVTAKPNRRSVLFQSRSVTNFRGTTFLSSLPYVCYISTVLRGQTLSGHWVFTDKVLVLSLIQESGVRTRFEQEVVLKGLRDTDISKERQLII